MNMETKFDAVVVLPIPTWEDRVYQAHPRSEAEHWPDKLKIGCMELEIADLREHIAAVERAAIQPAGAAMAPEGWQLVPVEPTPEMLEAAQALDEGNDDVMAAWSDAYSAMLAAAPTPGAK